VRTSHGLAETLAQLEGEPPSFREAVLTFLDGLVSHYVLDGGELVVAHAGMKAEMQGRASAAVRAFALYGETTGETDAYGLPVRLDWAADYRGQARVVYGHVAVPEARWENRTIDVDTGCVFGGRLTALRHPEGELVSVPAARAYYAPAGPQLVRRPGGPESEDAGASAAAGLLDLADFLGKRVLTTRLRPNLTIREEQAAAALETMTRFAVDPRWLIYLPPTMSPPETSQEPDLLEHPAEAFAYYASAGVGRVVCEEKHMGSRAVAVVCRDAEVARRRFGFAAREAGPGGDGRSGGRGAVYTRTGRPFFADATLEEALLDRLREALGAAGLWEALDTDWVCLDAEVLPWSAKAQALLRTQYAATGAAARAAFEPALAALAALPGDAGSPLLDRFRVRAAAAEAYVSAYRRYCWPVTSLADLKLAPFHLLASEGQMHLNRDHVWHMHTLHALCRVAPEVLLPTSYLVVDLDSPASRAAATEWWEALTSGGGEGMVVKPLHAITQGARGVVQPGVKCRGREYLRLIYGPEYTAPSTCNACGPAP
jgi:protein phosphatase